MSENDNAASIHRMGCRQATIVLTVVLAAIVGPHALRGTVPITPGSDPATQFYPWLDLARESLWAGEAPLWNPYAYAGSPLLANGQSAVFYPLNLPFYLFPDGAGLLLSLGLKFFLCGLFVWLLLRRFEVCPEAAVLGMLAATLSGYLIGWIAFPIANVVALLPAALWCALRAAKHPSLRTTALLALVLAAQALGGQPQSLACCWLLTAAFGLRQLPMRTALHSGASLGAAFVLGATAASVQLLPFWEYLGLSAALQVRSLLNHYWYPPSQHLITFVLPDFFGALGGEANWGFTPTREMTAYIGIAPLAAAAFSWRHARLRSLSLLLLGFCAVSLSLLYRWPSFALLSWLIEAAGLQGFGLQKLLGPVSICLALLAGIGFDRLLRRRRRMPVGWMIVGVAVLILIFGAAWIAHRDYIAGAGLMTNQLLGLGKAIVVLCLGWATLAAIRPRLLQTALLALLIVVDLGSFGASALPATPLAQLRRPAGSEGVWQRVDPATARVDSAGSRLPPNFGVFPRVAAARGYDALTPLSYMNYVDAVTGSRLGGNEAIVEAVRSGRVGSRDPNALRLEQFHRLYLHYGDLFLELLRRARYGFPELTPVRRRHLYDRLNIGVRVGEPAGSTAAWQRLGNHSFQNLQVVPRVRVADQTLAASSDEEMLEMLQDEVSARSVVLPASGLPTPSPAPATAATSPGSARITAYQPRTVTVEATSRGRGNYLVLADLYYPGWSVRLNGRPVPLLRADYLFRAVALPEGASRVEFRYDPALFAVGKWMSVTVLALIAAMAVVRPPSHSRVDGSNRLRL